MNNTEKIKFVLHCYLEKNLFEMSMKMCNFISMTYIIIQFISQIESVSSFYNISQSFDFLCKLLCVLS